MALTRITRHFQIRRYFNTGQNVTMNIDIRTKLENETESNFNSMNFYKFYFILAFFFSLDSRNREPCQAIVGFYEEFECVVTCQIDSRSKGNALCPNELTFTKMFSMPEKMAKKLKSRKRRSRKKTQKIIIVIILLHIHIIIDYNLSSLNFIGN